MKPVSLLLILVLTTLTALTACGGEGSEPGGTVHTAPGGAEFNDADAEFATTMLQHHAHALHLVDLTLGRRLGPEVRGLVEQVRSTRATEIQQLTTWLTDWERPVPETVRDHANAHGDGHGEVGDDLPGVPDADDLAALDSATDFERAWLELMVEHHEGALELAEDEVEDGHAREVRDLAGQMVRAQEAELETMATLLAR